LIQLCHVRNFYSVPWSGSSIFREDKSTNLERRVKEGGKIEREKVEVTIPSTTPENNLRVARSGFKG
jgi:hypothetical protein